MKHITLFGEELDIDFALGVEISYEEITGKPFNVQDLEMVKNTAAFYYAAIITYNPKTDISLDDIVYKASAADIATLREAVFGAFTDWCKTVGGGEEIQEEDGKKKA